MLNGWEGKTLLTGRGHSLSVRALSCSVLDLRMFPSRDEVKVSDAEAAPDQWKTWWIIFCLILGLVLMGLFVFVESRVSSPLMPLSIWRVPQFGKLMLCFGLGFGAFGGSIIFGWSLYFQQIFGASPIVVHDPCLCGVSELT
jgi:hypothetical protein